MLKSVVFILINVAFVRAFEDMTVLKYLETHNFGSFVQLLRETGQDTLLDGTGPFTVLAPTDAAVASLDPEVMSLVAHSALQEKQLVKYHIVRGYVLTPQLHQGSVLTSIEGQIIQVDKNQAGAVVLNNVSTVLGGSDVICTNGVVQPIGAVLVPHVFGHNNLMQELVLKDQLFNEFTLSVMLSNLTELVKNSEMTLFAPNDFAWGKHYQSILHPSTNYPHMDEFYIEMLKYHMVPGARTANMLSNGEKLYTVHGSPLEISISSTGAMHVNGYATVTNTDLPATNGVIHVVDDLLFPMDQIDKWIDYYEKLHNITLPRPTFPASPA